MSAPMTSGERLVWAAVYALVWREQTEFLRKYGGERSYESIAAEAASEARCAVEVMRDTVTGGHADDADDSAALAEMTRSP